MQSHIIDQCFVVSIERQGRSLSRCVCKTMWGFSRKTLERNHASESLIGEQKVGAIYFLIFLLYLFSTLNFVQLKVNFLALQLLLECEILGLGIHSNLKMAGRRSNSEHVVGWPNSIDVAKEALPRQVTDWPPMGG